MSKAIIKCPYCGHEIKNGFDYGEDSVLKECEELEDIECPVCLKIFDAVVDEIIAKISTYKREGCKSE